MMLRKLASASMLRSFSYGAGHRATATGFTNSKHRSNAMQNISQYPVVELDKNVAVCDGGGGNLGHPVEYIQLVNKDMTKPVACVYCGTRYIKKQH